MSAVSPPLTEDEDKIEGLKLAEQDIATGRSIPFNEATQEVMMMENWQVSLTDTAEKRIAKILQPERRSILTTITRLREDFISV